MKFPVVKRGVLLAVCTGNSDVFIRTFPQMADQHNNRTGSPLHQHGNKLGTGKLDRKVVVKPQISPKGLPRVSRSINDNYCVLNVAGVNSVHVSGKMQVLNSSPVVKKSETLVLHVNSFAANVHSVTGLPQKKGVNPNYCCTHTEIKRERCFLCRSLEFCNFCHKCPNCCHTSTFSSFGRNGKLWVRVQR